MNISGIEDYDLTGKRVLLRVDLDVPFVKSGDGYLVSDESRVNAWLPTVKMLLNKKVSEVILMGHIGRPQRGEGVSTMAFTTVASAYFWPKALEEENAAKPFGGHNLLLLENLRFYKGEEENDANFSKKIASLGDFYVNEAFAASHREHSSIVGVPKILPHAAGPHFLKEVENLSRVFQNPRRPVVVVIGGAKSDKLEYIDGFKKIADVVHIVGALPMNLKETVDAKVKISNLLPDKEDITINSIETIEKDVSGAGTIVLAGPIGRYEEEGHRQGTWRVFTAIAQSKAFRVAGGGDTSKAISMFGLNSSFDWISVGGGASLEFLTKGTLPGIEALLSPKE